MDFEMILALISTVFLLFYLTYSIIYPEKF